MIKLKKVFQIIYILLLTFMLANFLLGLFGHAFTPLLWNPWLYLGAVTAFTGLNLNLFVFLTHAIEGIKIEIGGEWENYTQIIFEPLWTIKRELVWLPMSGYLLFMVFYAAIYLYLRHRESIKN